MPTRTVLAIDRDLDACLRSELRGDVPPLALQRLGDEWGAQRPSIAIRAAVDDVLKLYRVRFPAETARVAVGRICEMLGVTLKGIRAGRSRAAPEISERPRGGHMGLVRFSPPRDATIEIPSAVGDKRARVVVAHELGHVLIHRRERDRFDEFTVRLPASKQEEALAEYAGRLLLLPGPQQAGGNLAASVCRAAETADVTLFAATCRLGDPDQDGPSVRGAVVWSMGAPRDAAATLSSRLTPKWHVCPGAFVPIGRCAAHKDSVIAAVAAKHGIAAGIQEEDVEIGELRGRYRVHAYAWGTVEAGTRVVLSLFEELSRVSVVR